MQDGQSFVPTPDLHGPPGAPSIREARRQLAQALAALDRALPECRFVLGALEALADARDAITRAEASISVARMILRNRGIR